jgi:hypothetical protein
MYMELKTLRRRVRRLVNKMSKRSHIPGRKPQDWYWAEENLATDLKDIMRIRRS